MDKYNELRTRINKHCPHLMELRFGCELKVEDDDARLGPEVGKFIRVDDKDGKDIWADVAVLRQGIVEGGSRYRVLEGAYIKEILGIPPTLQDVLVAMQNNIDAMYSIMPSSMVKWEGVFVTMDNINGIEMRDKYDLTKPLSEQSEETLDFLLEVIK